MKINKDNVKSVLMLTPMQQGMLLHYLSNPKDTTYIEQLCLKIKGEFSLEILRKTWLMLVHRHEVLRTVFRWEKLDRPVQIVLKSHEPDIRYHRIGQQDNADSFVTNMMDTDLREGMELEQVPFRITIMEKNSNSYFMLISHHHILYDGWSSSLLVREFSNLYTSSGESACRCTTAEFSDYVRYLAGGRDNASQIYWNSYLNQYHKTSLVQKLHNNCGEPLVNQEKIEFFPDQLVQIKKFCQETHITVAALLYGVFGLSLQKLWKLRDIVIGITVSGRSIPIEGIDQTVGLFIHTVPLRFDCRRDCSLNEFVKKINIDLADMIGHENCSMADLKRSLGLPASQELFEVVAIVENYPIDQSLLTSKDSLQIEYYKSFDRKASQPLCVEFRMFHLLEVRFKYQMQYMDNKTVQMLAESYLEIMEEVIHHPETMVHGLLPGLNVTNGLLEKEADTLPRILEARSDLVPDETEEELRRIWAGVLEIDAEKIGLDSDFFELGGQSLKLTYLILRLQKTFGIGRIKVSQIYRISTIRLMAAYIRTQVKERSDIPILPEQPCYISAPLQKNFYFSQKLYPESVHYNMVEAYISNGSIDRKKVTLALGLLYEKHECLRTSFFLKGGELYQKIHRHVQTPVFDLSCEGKSPDQIIQEFIRPFDLSQAPLFKVGIASLNGSENLIVFQLHHIISDGISNQILVRDFLTAYKDGILEGSGTTYKDFSAWKSLQDFSASNRYWQNRLSNGISKMDIPPSPHSTGGKSWRGGSFKFTLDKSLSCHLRRIAGELQVSLFSVLFSCWIILLHKLTSQTEIITSTVASGRTHPAIENIVGLFVNTLPFYCHIDGTQTFHAFVLQLHQIFLEDMDHQDYSFSQLIQDLHIDRSLDETPLFNTMFVMQNMKQIPLSLTGVSLEKYQIDRGFTKYDLCLFAQTDTEALSFEVEYRTDLFLESRVRLFMQYLTVILNKAVQSGCDALINEISILLPEQKQAILQEWNPIVSWPGQSETVQALFQAQVRKTPDNVAVLEGDMSYTYSALDKMANRIAHSLHDRGVKPHTIIGLYLENSVMLIASVLAILKLGAAYLPIDIETPMKRLEFILDDSQCYGLIKQASMDEIKKFPNAVPVWDVDSLIACGNDTSPKPQGSSEDVIYIIYTSGTTGQPKGCLLKQQGVCNYLQWAVSAYYNKNTTYSFAFFSSPAFDLSVTSMLSPLISGQTVTIYPRKLEALYHVISDRKCNIIKVTPTQLRLLLGMNCKDSVIETIIVGGEQLTAELAGRAAQAFGMKPRIFNEYGPTETVVGCMIHQYNPDADTGGSVPIGVPIANMQIYVLNQDRTLCAPGVRGEIYIAGVGVFPGYLNRPELNSNAFIFHEFGGAKALKLYKTGDMGVLSENGLLYYCGRANDLQAKIRGYRVETEEIRQAILQFPDVVDATVILKEGKADDQNLCAFVVSESPVSFQELKTFLKDRLPQYMLPAYFYSLDQIFTTPSGKVDKEKLLALSSSGVSAEQPQKEYTGAAAILAHLWHSYLDSDRILPDDNFFDIGGNSFLLLKIHEDLSAKYPQVKVADFFKYPTLRSMADYLDGKPDRILAETACTDHKETQKSSAVAVIGIGINLSNATCLDEFKNVLEQKKDCITSLSPQREADVRNYLSFIGTDETSYNMTQAAFLERIDLFDYKFFRITRMEAELMDPYQRLLLQMAQRTFDDAGYRKSDIKGTRTGVYVGQPYPTNYYDRVKRISPESAVISGPGNVDSIIAGRISHYYDLIGPSLLVNTACSSSLSALHMACSALRCDEIEMALVCGVNVIMDPVRYEGEPVPEIVSSTSRARTFSEDSDGTGRGEGCIAVLLKQYDKAVLDQDNIYAVIRGSAMNNDGQSIGITAPNVNMQERVIQQALEQSGLEPSTIGFVEAHGTGTKLGDPVEVTALSNVFRRSTDKKQFCALGAVKTNYGHLDSASGLLGFVKAVASLRYKTIFPNIHMTYPNSKIDFIRSPFYLPVQAQFWETNDNQLRQACVSAFGLSGTNCHVILEENQTPESAETKVPSGLFLVTAKSESALRSNIAAYLSFIKENSSISLLNVCYTTQVARDHYVYRAAVVCNSIEELTSKLRVLYENSASSPESGIFYGKSQEDSEGKAPLEIKDITNLDEKTLSGLAESFVHGQSFDWAPQYSGLQVRKLHLPPYEFDPLRSWINVPAQKTKNVRLQMPELKHEKRTDIMKQTVESTELQILQKLIRFVAEMFNENEQTIDKSAGFYELGIDSISIIQLKQYINETYYMEVSIDQLLNEWNSLELVAHNISLAEEKKNQTGILNLEESALNVPVVSADGGALFAKQLENIEKQLEVLRKIGLEASFSHFAPTSPGQSKATAAHVSSSKAAEDVKTPQENQHYHAMGSGAITEDQQKFLNHLKKRYVSKTARSKQLAQEQKKTWANGRFSMGFSNPWKEILYPIFAVKGERSKIWDEDGNAYIDFAMGFGVHLFGHKSPLIVDAIQKQLNQGVFLGPLNKLAGEVAQLICEMTGVERVAFCNSGTEAVMNLVRLARAATGKNKIAMFSGAFHGTFDGVYMMADLNGQSEKPVPVSLGTPASMAEDVIILPYGENKAFDILTAHQDELAAVLVEPVQSRDPDLQPAAFLHKLRQFTRENGIALIFDEVITGFRTQAGGAQAYFGVKADLVAYGKVVGGGLPIGIFAGDARYLDKVDGGYWDYGDNSGPYTSVVQTGGTFRGHPLTMACAKEVLNYMRQKGPAFQEGLNEKTRTMAEYLNEFFSNAGVPIRIAYFSSLFIFKSQDAVLLRFLFYLLIEKGFYLWEGGTCFVSSAHTEADLCLFAAAVQEAVADLVSGAGYQFKISTQMIRTKDLQVFPCSIQKKKNMERCLALIAQPKDRELALQWFVQDKNIRYIYPVTSMQQLILTQNLMYRSEHQDISILSYHLHGNVNQDCFRQSWNHMIDQYPILKTGFQWRKVSVPLQIVYEKLDVPYEYFDCSGKMNLEDAERIYSQEMKASFDNGKPPLIKIILLKLDYAQYRLIIKYQNSLFDGWSAGILFKECMQTYHKLLHKKNLYSVEQEYSLLPYLEWLSQWDQKEAATFWRSIFHGFDQVCQTNCTYEMRTHFEPGMYTCVFSPEEVQEIKNYGKAYGLTPNTLFQGAWGLFHCQLQRKNDLVTAVVCSGRPEELETAEKIVGLFSNVIPVRIHFGTGEKLAVWFQALQQFFNKAKKFEHMTANEISEIAGVSRDVVQSAIYTRTLVYLNYPNEATYKESEISIDLEDEQSYVNVPFRVYAEPFHAYQMIARYDKYYFKAKDVSMKMERFKAFFINLLKKNKLMEWEENAE